MRSSKERMCIGKKREVVEKEREGICWEKGGGREGKGRKVLGGAQGRVRSN